VRPSAIAFVPAFLCTVGACSIPAAEQGEALFSDPGFARATSNAFSCATCHERVATPTVVRPGYTMWGVTRRSSFWGGKVPTALDAVSQCVTAFMAGNPLPADDEDGRALYVYLDTLRDSITPTSLPLTTVSTIKDVPSGDATRGRATFDAICRTCHGEPHTGEGRLTTLDTVIPDETLTEHGTDPVTGARIVTIEKVRHGKFFDIGGRMPPFSLEALSDAQLGDVLAYLETFGLPPGAAK
jgi:thiosulfate dehydrogenase